MWTQCLNLGLRSSIRFAQPREAQLSRVFTQCFVRGAGYDRAEKSKQQVEFRVHFFFTWLCRFIAAVAIDARSVPLVKDV